MGSWCLRIWMGSWCLRIGASRPGCSQRGLAVLGLGEELVFKFS